MVPSATNAAAHMTGLPATMTKPVFGQARQSMMPIQPNEDGRCRTTTAAMMPSGTIHHNGAGRALMGATSSSIVGGG